MSFSFWPDNKQHFCLTLQISEQAKQTNRSWEQLPAVDRATRVARCCWHAAHSKLAKPNLKRNRMIQNEMQTLAKHTRFINMTIGCLTYSSAQMQRASKQPFQTAMISKRQSPNGNLQTAISKRPSADSHLQTAIYKRPSLGDILQTAISRVLRTRAVSDYMS